MRLMKFRTAMNLKKKEEKIDEVRKDRNEKNWRKKKNEREKRKRSRAESGCED